MRGGFSASWFPEADNYRVGVEALRAWTGFTDAFETFEVRLDRIIDAGDQVVALTHIQARGQASGAAVDAFTGGIFTLRGGKIVRTMWEAFLRRDFDKALSRFHPDVEWDGTNLPDGKISHGHEAILDHTARWADQWESWTVELGEFLDAGDDVVIFVHERGRSKSGIDMDERHAEIYTVKAGIIVRRRGFSDRAEALEAVGLRE